MNVKVDKEKCIGCGTCVSLAGAVFLMTDDGKAGVIAGADLEANAAQINQAKDACPVAAITIE